MKRFLALLALVALAWAAPFESSGVQAVAVAPDGSVVTAGNGALTLWKSNGERISTQMCKLTWNLAIDPRGRWLASCYDIGGHRVVDVCAYPGLEGRTVVLDSANCMAFTPDGKSLLAAGDGMLVRYDLKQRKVVQTREISEGIPSALAISPNGKTVVLGLIPRRGQPASSDCLLLEAGGLGTIRQLPLGNQLGVSRAAFSPDGEYFAVSYMDLGSACLYHSNGAVFRTIEWMGEGNMHQGRSGLAFSPDSRKLAVGGSTLRIFSLPGFKMQALPRASKYMDAQDCAFDRDSHRLFTVVGERLLVRGL